VVAVLIAAWLAVSSASIVVTGVVSDEACGAAHLKDQKADCVLKCLRGGASIGHPEWLPQRMVLVERRSGRIFVVANPDALRGHEGQIVRVQATLQNKPQSIRVLEVLPPQ